MCLLYIIPVCICYLYIRVPIIPSVDLITLSHNDLVLRLDDPSPSSRSSRNGYILRGPVLLALPVQVLLQLALVLEHAVLPISLRLLFLVLVVLVGFASARRSRPRIVHRFRFVRVLRRAGDFGLTARDVNIEDHVIQYFLRTRYEVSASSRTCGGLRPSLLQPEYQYDAVRRVQTRLTGWRVLR